MVVHAIFKIKFLHKMNLVRLRDIAYIHSNVRMCLVETRFEPLPNQYASKDEDGLIERYEGKNTK